MTNTHLNQFSDQRALWLLTATTDHLDAITTNIIAVCNSLYNAAKFDGPKVEIAKSTNGTTDWLTDTSEVIVRRL